MIRVKGSDIQITRGDTGYLSVGIGHIDDEPYTRQDGDKLVFTVKRRYDINEILLQKDIDGLLLSLNPKDTKSLTYGCYWYDIELTTNTGQIFTVVGPARFVVREEVKF